MLESVIKYGAVSVKIRALMGKMLTKDDWNRLCACKSTAEIGSYLGRCPGWSEALDGLPPRFTSMQLQNALKAEYYAEFQRIYRFASNEDRKYLYFAVCRVELQHILAALRRQLSVNSLADEEVFSDFFKSKSKIDLAAVAESRDFTSLQNAVKGSIFYDTLQRVPKSPVTGLPDYSMADMMLDLKLRSTVYSYITKGYSGMEKQQLIRFIGHEADLLNIVHILRLRRFSDTVPQAERLLIPIRWRLKTETVKALAASADDNDAMAVLNAAGWGKYFTDGLSNPERSYRIRMEAFCRKLLRTTQPNLCTVQAYLTMKEQECDGLVRVVQAVNYGIDPTMII